MDKKIKKCIIKKSLYLHKDTFFKSKTNSFSFFILKATLFQTPSLSIVSDAIY